MGPKRHEQVPSGEFSAAVVAEVQYIAESDPTASFYTYTTPANTTPQPLAGVLREKPGTDSDHIVIIFDRPETTDTDETQVVAVHAPTDQQRRDFGYSLDAYHEVTENGGGNIEADSYDDAIAQLRNRLFANDNDRPEQMDTDKHARNLASRAGKALERARANADRLLPARTVAIRGLAKAVAHRRDRAAKRKR